VRELHIDWAALHSAFQMNMPEVRCFFSIEDGRVLKLPPGDPGLATVRTDPTRYLPVEAIPSRIQYQWLDDFIKSVEDETTKMRMEAAINGKGAFRRFKDILLTLPDERRRWFEFRDQMMRQRIIDWVREQGILASNEPSWQGVETSEMDLAMGGAGTHSTGFASLPGLTTGATSPSFSAPASTLTITPVVTRPTAHNGHGQIQNGSVAVEALRDYLIEWADQRNLAGTPSPIELEDLAHEVAKRFRLMPLQ
jgi:hypothetical protein